MILVLLVAGLFMVLLVASWPDLLNHPRLALSFAIPAIISILSVALAANERFRFHWQRWWAILTGRRVTVIATSRFRVRGVNAETVLDTAARAVKSGYPGTKAQHRSRSKLTLEWSHLAIILSVEPTDAPDLSQDEEIGWGEDDDARDGLAFQLNVRIIGAQPSLRRLQSEIEETLSVRLNSLRDALDLESEAHQLEIIFPAKHNPYFGLYIRRVPIDSIHQFLCQIDNSVDGNKAFVSINQRSLTIDSDKPHVLIQSAKRFLSAPSS